VHAAPPIAGQSTAEAGALYRKVILRLMPFLILAFATNAIDRINISFAKLRMAEDFALSDAAYGIGAGIFYFGYVLFEIPSNLLLQRFGARATLTRIMLLWGAITVGTAFVTTSNQLIVARFLLGAAEAGFFAGVILYLTYWFPSVLRGRITAAFVMSGIVAGIVSGPLAGVIMSHFDGWLGLRGWQALFVFEGIPAVLLGVFGWFWLADKPEQAPWLDREEKHALASELERDAGREQAHGRLRDVFRDPRVYIAGLVYLCISSGTNTVGYWMPTLIRGFGVDDLKTIGLLASLPFVGALFGMYLLGRSSDKRLERRWHVALTMLTSAACFFALGFMHDALPLAVLLMAVGAAAAFCAIPLFWTIPPALLPAPRAAAGIAMISSMGNLAGVLSQAGVGAIKSATGNLYLAFDVIAAVLLIGTLILLIGIPAHRLHERRAAGSGADR
jgi:MFS family permease